MSNLPTRYKWLEEIETLPKTISEAIKLLGVAEVVGKGSNKTIIGWRDELNQNGVKIVGYSDDDIPWCGLFAAIVCFRRKGVAADVVSSPLWARGWSNYGTKQSTAVLGDILVFERAGGGGHVGFYIGEDPTHYHVLGGNQQNAVTITRITKKRCLAIRRPNYENKPDSAKVYRLSSNGIESKNEA